jgi:hypothetical protein
MFDVPSADQNVKRQLHRISNVPRTPGEVTRLTGFIEIVQLGWKISAAKAGVAMTKISKRSTNCNNILTWKLWMLVFTRTRYDLQSDRGSSEVSPFKIERGT